ncbi:MAG: HD domain-containing protein [Spirochaetaceae bacterium]|nr:HD domain-containing protein [Spirochaetaceae bacterium]
MSDMSLLLSISNRFDNVIRDPVWGDIHFDDSFAALIQTQPFQVLDGIRQLGPVAFVYPGATHTRKLHSLGVYYLTRRLTQALLERGQLPFATKTGLRSFLVAALCHDIGHYPYAHSLKELPLTPHEALAGDLVLQDPLRKAILDCSADPEQVAAIIDSDRVSPRDHETIVYRRILSGVLDPDKIDYLTRDAYYCGVPYGIQDADFIMRKLFIVDDQPGIDEKSEMSVEAVLFSKYQMYRSVYWHPTVRSATSMVKKSILLGLSRLLINSDSLYGLDDHAFTRLFSGSTAEEFIPARLALSGRFYPLVAEIPYDGANVIHHDLSNLDKRLEAEASLAMAANIPETDIVIDIPEPINFESNFRIKTAQGWLDFSARPSVFGPSTLESLQVSLRKIRIFADPSVDSTMIRGLARELLS